jgi:hypothetical protein
MEDTLAGLVDRHLAGALRELERELAAFDRGGLVRLRADLRAGRILRRSWEGCPLSYRHGGPGSVGRDRRGQPRNPFTALWDAGRITDRAVAVLVDRELGRREGPMPDPGSGRRRGRPASTRV